MPTVHELFREMPESFNPEAAQGIEAVILFDITGEGGGRFFITLRDGGIRIDEDLESSPDLTIRATAKDYVDIATGALNEQLAFMTGRIRAKGNTRLAMRLPKLFPR